MSSGDFTPEPNADPIAPATTPEAIPETPPAPPPRFDAQPYAPDGSAPPLGLGLTLGGGLVAAVVVGSLIGIIGQWLYLVLLFPLMIGFALGGIGMGLIKVGKLRNPLLAGVAATLIGVMAMGTIHYVNYQLTLNELAKRFPIGRDNLENQMSFFRYIDLTAVDGVTLTSTHDAQGKGGMNLGYTGSYIYWLVEVIMVAAVAWVMMQKAAAAPFCVSCNAWKNDRPLAMVTVPAERMATQAVNEGDVVSLLPCAGPIQPVGLLLKTAVCPCCGADGEVDIALERVTKNSKGQQQSKTLTRATYPGEVLRYLSS